MSTSSDITALNERDNFLTNLAEAVGSRAKVSTVFGDPIVRERMTVVPVACARWGFGGGSGQQHAGQPSGLQRVMGAGGGGGGGMVVNPVGYLVIGDRGVEYHGIHNTLRVLTAILAGVLLARIFRRARRKT